MSVRSAGAASGRLSPGQRALVVLRLARWPNALISCAGVLVGAWWAAGRVPASSALAWALVTAVLLTAVVNATNDLLDIAIDRVAHPDRPLPRGLVSPRAVTYIVLVTSTLAMLAALRAGGWIPTFAMVTLGVGAVYSGFLKPHGVAGNLAVAFVASLPFLVGADAVGDVAAGLPLLGVAVPLHLAREILKDMADAPGDVAVRRTIVVRQGPRVARAAAVAAVAVHVALVTFLFAPAGLRRLALAPAMVLAAWAVLRAPAARAALLLKLSMLLAMAALPLLR